MSRERRNVRVHMLLSEQEANIIRERMAELGIVNQSAYFRKMAIGNSGADAIDKYLLQQSQSVCETR